MDIPITIRGLDPPDLAGLDWSGGPEHLRAIARDLSAAAAGEIIQRVVALPNGALIGFGAADLRKSEDSGTLWMLSVHETWQSLGIGALLIRALEDAIVRCGRSTAVIAVEHDNPRARDLYRRLGYREAGSEVQSWPVGNGRIYVTVCAVLRRRLR